MAIESLIASADSEAIVEAELLVEEEKFILKLAEKLI